jgi:hypothetical protein
MQDPEFRRRWFGWDLDRLVEIFGWAGIVDRLDATVELDHYSRGRLVGGRLRLSVLGKWWIAGE